MKNVRGSPPYYQRTFYELLAMVRQLGTPTWFFTVSAADLKWPDMIRVIASHFVKFYKTDEEIEQLTFEERCNWIRRNPVAAARHFHYRLNCSFTDFLVRCAAFGRVAGLRYKDRISMKRITSCALCFVDEGFTKIWY